MTRAGSIAVALHDVEPATFERCALIRDWLSDHGVARATLLVIPAPDLLVGTTASASAGAGDVWDTRLGFVSPLPSVPAGHYTTTVTFTVIGR